MLTRTRHKKPVPWAITCALGFIDDNLSQMMWEQELRKIIRAWMPTVFNQENETAFIDLYDDRINTIIEEEMTRN